MLDGSQVPSLNEASTTDDRCTGWQDSLDDGRAHSCRFGPVVMELIEVGHLPGLGSALSLIGSETSCNPGNFHPRLEASIIAQNPDSEAERTAKISQAEAPKCSMPHAAMLLLSPGLWAWSIPPFQVEAELRYGIFDQSPT